MSNLIFAVVKGTPHEVSKRAADFGLRVVLTVRGSIGGQESHVVLATADDSFPCTGHHVGRWMADQTMVGGQYPSGTMLWYRHASPPEIWQARQLGCTQ